MISTELSIGELADAAGVSRRTVRFYVQQRLLPVPLGRGRGRHYDQSHLQRLRRINELQAAGHSLDSIRRILHGGEPAASLSSPAPAASPRRAQPATLSAELWRRLRLGEGVELHYDAARHSPTFEQLMRLREAVRAALAPDHDGNADDGNHDDGT